MGITQQLAEFLVTSGFDAMPPDVTHAAKRAIIETVGVILAGSQEPASRTTASFVRKTGGNPRATVLGNGLLTSAPNAALANGISGHALDYDDVFSLVSVAHPTAVLLPAVLAVTEDSGASGKAVIEGIVLGLEVLGRLMATGIDPRPVGFYVPSIVGTLGAAAGASKVLRLDVHQTQMALGVAASQATGMARNRGTMTKPFHAGNAARSGVVAAMLASEGFTAEPNIIEGELGLCHAFAGKAQVDESKVVDGLGNPYCITSPGLSVKKYPTCWLTHSSIDMMIGLAKEHAFSPEEVMSIECRTQPRSGTVLVFMEPSDHLQAKFSMPFALAAALVEGKVGLPQITDAKANDARIRNVARKVTVRFDARNADPDTLTVRLKDGRQFSASTTTARGNADAPLSDDEISTKFIDCATMILPADKAGRALELMLDLERLSAVSDLTGLLH